MLVYVENPKESVKILLELLGLARSQSFRIEGQYTVSCVPIHQWSAQACINKYNTQGGLNNRHLLLRSDIQEGQVLVRALFLTC